MPGAAGHRRLREHLEFEVSGAGSKAANAAYAFGEVCWNGLAAAVGVLAGLGSNTRRPQRPAKPAMCKAEAGFLRAVVRAYSAAHPAEDAATLEGAARDDVIRNLRGLPAHEASEVFSKLSPAPASTGLQAMDSELTRAIASGSNIPRLGSVLREPDQTARSRVLQNLPPATAARVTADFQYQPGTAGSYLLAAECGFPGDTPVEDDLNQIRECDSEAALPSQGADSFPSCRPTLPRTSGRDIRLYVAGPSCRPRAPSPPVRVPTVEDLFAVSFRLPPAATPSGWALRFPPSVPTGSLHPARISPCWAQQARTPASAR